MTSVASVDQPRRRPGVASPAGGPVACACSGRSRSALALLSALVTFVVLAGLTPIAPTHQVVVTLLLVNGGTVLVLLAIIAREVWQVVQARRRGRAAARLHVRIVGLFSVIAAVPAILVAIVASVTLDRGLDRLFSTRTRAVIENSLIVADAYRARARPDDPRRHRGDGDRRRRAPSRCSIRTATASASSSPRRPRCAACPAR